ncbi:MAG: hypothetical protein QXG97_05545 [Nitrososphaerota archaeon]
MNATKGADDIEAKGFYRMFRLPRDIEVGKASFRENNRVLDETIPRQANSPELWAEGEVE